MAGTTINDNINGTPLVLKSYQDAFRESGINISIYELNEHRGRDKYTVIQEFGGTKANLIFTRFTQILLENVQHVKGMEGAVQTFRFLHDNYIKVALNTGFPKEVAKSIIDKLGWERSGLIDAWICSEMVSTSRPDPSMIFALMHQFGIDDSLSVMKIDDTVKGLEEGLMASVITVGVLTGTQSKEMLLKIRPHHIIENVAQLPLYLKEWGYC